MMIALLLVIALLACTIACLPPPSPEQNMTRDTNKTEAGDIWKQRLIEQGIIT